MKANELRIGNYIASSGNPKNKETWVIGKVHYISSLNAKFEQIEVETEEEFTWFFKDSYFGIPLTEEWLLKFGFEKVDVNEQYEISCSINERKSVINVSIEDEVVIDVHTYNPKDKYGAWLNTPNKHVHQLQNLYHALTGEELKTLIRYK